MKPPMKPVIPRSVRLVDSLNRVAQRLRIVAHFPQVFWSYWKPQAFPSTSSSSCRAIVGLKDSPNLFQRIGAFVVSKYPRLYSRKLEQNYLKLMNKSSLWKFKVRKFLVGSPRPSRPRDIREFNPVISQSDFSKLQNQVQKLQKEWETKSSEESGPGPTSSVITVKSLEQSQPPTGLISTAAEQAESIHIDVSQLKRNLKITNSKETGVAVSSNNNDSYFMSNLNRVVGMVPQIPSVVNTVVQDYFLKNLPSFPDYSSSSATTNNKNENSNKKLPSKVTAPPGWKSRTGSSTSKSLVDARTRFCVNSLRTAEIENESRYLRRLEMFCTHLHEFPYAKGVAVRENVIGELLHVRRKSSDNDAIKMLVKEALDLCGYHDPVKGQGIRILSLDGGGMRGLTALEILKEIEENTGGKRIHELFDFVCGVSTGSIILAFLAFHKYSVSQVEEIYRTIGSRIFTQNVWKGTSGILLSHSYYDTKQFAKTLQKLVSELKMNDTLRSPNTPSTAIVGTLVSGHKISPYVFRNYQYPYRSQSFYRGSARYALWEAVRASSAAPGYFDEFVKDDKIFHDGGIMTNNATMVAIHEAQKLWPNEEIQCVVSIGMGRHERPLIFEDDSDFPSKPKSLSLAQKFNRIIDAATDTEINHMTLSDLLPGHVYYRFNPFMQEYYPLDEVRPEKMEMMREDTTMYIRRNQNRILEACNQLQVQRNVFKRAKDHFKEASEVVKARIIYSKEGL